jgi:hypothetical protein
MPKKNSINGIHAQRLKAIRPFIDFDYDLRKPLTKYQKSRIREYYKEVDALTARPYYVFRPRSKQHLIKAQQFAQHEKSLPGLKVAFIPTSGTTKPIIRFKNGKYTQTIDHVTTELIQFNKTELIKDSKGHVENVIKEKRNAKRFTILAGRYEIPRSYSRNLIAQYVAQYTAKYSNPDKNNYFGNWMVGLAAHHFKDQATFTEYQSAKYKAKVKLKTSRRNRKRRRQRIK